MEHLDKFLKWLNDNKWLNFIFLLLAIVSIIVSFYLYLKSKKKKKPQYSKRSINVVSDRFQNVANVDVSYQGSKVNNLTVTKVAIWNGGNDTINSSDMASSDPLRMIAEDGVIIFNSEVIKYTNITNNITSLVENNIVEISFDYLDQKQGGIIKIIHSGKSSSDINIRGTFKGAGEIKELDTTVFNEASSFLSNTFLLSLNIKSSKNVIHIYTKIFPWVSIIVGIGMLIAYFFIDIDKDDDSIVIAILGGFYLILGLSSVFRKNILPKNFDAFYDDE